MYTIEFDTHTHSLISLHACSTVEECAVQAAQKGLRGFAVTDHCSLNMAQRENSLEAVGGLSALPPVMHGVRVLKGVEIDIVDRQGRLAFEDRPDPYNPGISGAQGLLRGRELVIASVHSTPGGSLDENTEMYCRALENPYVDILGHTGRSGRPYHLRPVLETARRLGKMIEINNASLENYADRAGTPCLEIAKMCMELGVLITVGSDAHSAYQLGSFSSACAMLESIHFPEALVANLHLEDFEARLKKRREESVHGA